MDQAAFLLEAIPKSGIGEGLQHAHHRRGNARSRHEVHDATTGTIFFTIETDDEPCHHADAIGGDAIHGRVKRIACVLDLAGGFEAGLIGRFNAEEHTFETGFMHHAHHLVVIGKIH